MRPSTAASLLAQIVEGPDDDGLRLVYADVLQEAGDPRGELIALQFQRHRQGSARVSEREKELLDQHAFDWLGPLWRVTARQRFERGFLFACKLERGVLEWERWREAVGHPTWGTVRELHVGRDEGEWVRELLLSPVLRRLRRITDVPAARLAEICDSDGEWDIEEVDCTLVGRPLGTARHSLAARRSLPSLRHLVLAHFPDHPDARDHDWLAGSPLVAGLATLRIGTSRPTLLGGWVRLLQRGPGLSRLLLGDDFAPPIVVNRDAEGRLSSLEMDYAPSQLGGLLAALGSLDDDALTSLKLFGETPSPAARAQIEQATRRFPRLAPLAAG